MNVITLFKVYNNPKWVDMPLKSIIIPIIYIDVCKKCLSKHSTVTVFSETTI